MTLRSFVQGFLVLFFVALACLYVIPSVMLVLGHTFPSASIEEPPVPKFIEQVKLSPVDYAKAGDTFTTQAKVRDQEIDGYKQQIEAYKLRLEVYKLQTTGTAALPRADFAVRVKQVTDAINGSLTNLLLAFITFAGLNTAGQVMANLSRVKRGQDVEPVNPVRLPS